MDKKQIYAIIRKVIFTAIIVLVVVFIFYNSSRIGTVSGALSQNVTTLFNQALSRLGIGFTFTNLIVRKLGHLAEFCLLGFWLMLGLRVYTRRTVAFIAWPLLAGLAIAVGDEFLQSFIPGRTSSVIDVAIDFAGVLLGIAVAAVCIAIAGAIWRHLRKRKHTPMPLPSAPATPSAASTPTEAPAHRAGRGHRHAGKPTPSTVDASPGGLPW